MRKILLLYITDEEAFLFDDLGQELFKGGISEAILHFQKQLIQKKSLHIYIDRSHQDVHEEKLPPLYPWDRWRLLSHKRSEFSSQGGFSGIQILREGKDRYLRWIHISKWDPIYPLLLKATDGIFFVPLELGSFMRKEGSDSSIYQMFVYPLPYSKARHVIFKGKRMLLSRITQEGDDIKASLHFLSRTFPDIFEMFHVKHFEDLKPVLKYLATRKLPVLPFCNKLQKPYAKICGVVVLSGLISGMIFEVAQGISFKYKTILFFPQIDTINLKINKINPTQDVESIRKALTQYNYLKSHQMDPLTTFQELSAILDKHQVRLIKLDWRQGKEIDLFLTFLREENLTDQFDPLVNSLRDAFPKGQIQVIEAPFNSSAHESFKGVDKEAIPIAHIRIVPQ